eukprot:gene18089-biopygen855
MPAPRPRHARATPAPPQAKFCRWRDEGNAPYNWAPPGRGQQGGLCTIQSAHTGRGTEGRAQCRKHVRSYAWGSVFGLHLASATHHY